MLYKLVKYDIKWGIVEKWKKYLMMLLLALVISTIFIKNCEYSYAKGKLETMPGYFDYIMNLLHGMKKNISNGKDEFKIPVEWMTFHLFIAFSIGNYLAEDLEKCGVNVIIRGGSRKKWIVSKIIWNILAVLSFYVIIYLGNFVLALINTGKIQLSLTQAVSGKFYEMNLEANQVKYIVALIILPILSSFAISQMQMFLSLFVKPIISFLMVASLLILSAYTMSPYLIGNYSMLQRSAIFMKEGISIFTAVSVNLIIIFLSIGGSIISFNKKNIV